MSCSYKKLPPSTQSSDDRGSDNRGSDKRGSDKRGPGINEVWINDDALYQEIIL